MVFALDRMITQNLTHWPEAELAFFGSLARVGESDWMLIPTLLVWVLSQTMGWLKLGYTKSWAVRSIGGMSGFIFVSVAVPGIIAAVLKVAIGRARPMLMDEVGIFNFTPFAGDWRYAGFPSGHATTAFALACALYFLFGKRAGIVFIAAFLISLSRIVDGVHYFSDVIAGSMLGTFGAIWVRDFCLKKRWGFDVTQSETTKGAQNRFLRPVARFLRRRFSKPKNRQP